MRRISFLFSPLILYIGISFFFFGTTKNWQKAFFGVGNDPSAFAWCLNWWPFAIRHGLNLFQTKYVWYPQGFNLTWCTSVPFLAFLTAPITRAYGPVLSFNILTLADPALAAWTAYLLMRELTGDWKAALVGGYLFGFSSYELGQLEGHLNLDTIFLVPVVLLLCVRRFKGNMGRAGFVGGMCTTLLAQMGISTEILATVCLFGAIAWAVFCLCAQADDRKRFLRLAFDICCTAVPTALLASPFLYYLFKGLSELPAEMNPTEPNSGDPVNLIIPNVVTRLGSKAFFNVYIHFPSGGSEQELYLGLPLIIILTVFFRQRVFMPYVKALLLLIGMFTIFSCGPKLHVAGILTELTMPWKFMQHIPLMQHVLPVRFCMYVALIAAIVATLWLAEVKNTRQVVVRYASAAAAICFLLPNPDAYRWTPWPTQAFFTSTHIEKSIGLRKNVLILPFSTDGPQMFEQLNAGMAFTQSGGYLGIVPQSELRWNIVPTLLYGAQDPDFRNDFTAYCDTHKVDVVLIGPQTSAELKAKVAALGWQHHLDGDTDVLQVPASAMLHYYYVAEDYYHGTQFLNWMGKRARIITHGTKATVTLDGHMRGGQTPVNVEVSGPAHGLYSIGPSDTKTFDIPANATITVTASDTFIISKEDGRAFSLMLGIEPHP